MNIEELVGKEFKEIDIALGKETISFKTNKGEVFTMMHSQDCCEDVSVYDICGRLGDLLYEPIIEAFEKTNSEEHPKDTKYNSYDCFTWTFYTMVTAKGAVTFRWIGESNGYYSEDVDIIKG